MNFATIEQAASAITPRGFVLKKIYKYGQESAVLRYENASGKTFRQVSKIDGEWIAKGLPENPLYNIDMLMVDHPGKIIVIAEGEKAADALTDAGYIGITNAGGAGAVAKTNWRPLAGLPLVIWRDNDDAGKKHLASIIAILEKLEPQPTVRIVYVEDLEQKMDAANLGQGPIHIRIKEAKECRLNGTKRTFQQTEDDTEVSDAYEAYRSYEESSQEYGIAEYEAQTSITSKRQKIELPFSAPIAYAEAVLEEKKSMFYARWRQEWYAYDGGSYMPVSDEWMEASGRRVLEKCIVPEIVKGEPTGQMIPLMVKNNVLSETLGSIRAREGVMLGDLQDSPMWRKRDPQNNARDCIALSNGIFNSSTGEFLGRRPELFITGHSAFAYNQDAPSPVRWIAFLNQIFEHDTRSIDCLQEWMGYQLTYQYPWHKSLYICGPKRAGKGTIASVLAALVGTKSCASPTLDQLPKDFGLQQLIGKRSAIIGDARFTGGGGAAAKEMLLGLISNDSMSINRKNKDFWNGKLSCKLTIMSNDMPSFKDDSGTIMSRFIFMRLKKSFYGIEDLKLTEELLSEMPGVFLWSFEGLKRLRSNGRFTMPECHEDELFEMENSANPIRIFVEQQCDFVEGASETTGYVYDQYKKWCKDSGRDYPKSIDSFGRSFLSCCPVGSVQKLRKMEDGIRSYSYEGIRLKWIS